MGRTCFGRIVDPDKTLDIMVLCSAHMDKEISTQDRLVNKMPLVAILVLAIAAFAMVYIF